MDIKIFEDIKNTFQVIIQCKKIDKEVLRLKKHIELFDKKLYAKKNNELFLISSSDILYFDSVDNHTFLYTNDDVMEIKQKLYELKPKLNRTILVTMFNGEQLYISRKYVKLIRNMLAI